MTAVLDASALLALLKGEPGAERVAEALERGAYLSAVNLAEVLSKLADWGEDPAEAQARMAQVGLLGAAVEVLPFTGEDALEVARLRALTRAYGLSFGDRACLALARRLGLPALTAERAWAELDLGIPVEVLRP
ncbi:VapC toxin family PIN domain ribonuclease [Thermus scotoductus]|uniref:Ribonuclease VapC n=1 Tax=Thermus scotoductus TaxID=37636 RepID=A0A430R902_THESC|nr:type II toxin-antitoxin system VapC family toxin [Thermus scotoductus]RTH03912.1 VapC toxin family PIN domain ribonuclease [Thermus scotoductus]RTI57160.1 VapC toxin family PIN domain ribonuclease [Thermus scotoductus]